MKIKEFEAKFLDFDNRYQENFDEKNALTKYAAENFIEDGDIIFLDGGTTIMTMLPHIKQRNVTVITNGINTLSLALQCMPHLTVICPGGEL